MKWSRGAPVWLTACMLLFVVCGQGAVAGTVRDFHDQPPMTNEEVERFCADFSSFRMWMVQHELGRSAARPDVDAQGNPTFIWTAAVEPWFAERDWKPERFFYVMTHCSAGMMVLLHPDAFAGDNRPPDMPEISEYELNLVRQYMDDLIAALASDAKE